MCESKTLTNNFLHCKTTPLAVVQVMFVLMSTTVKSLKEIYP